MFGRVAALLARIPWAEVLVALAALGGWVLLTWTAAELVSPWVWPVSGGVGLLTLCGWRFLFTVAVYGLYSLTRDDDRGGE